MTDKKKPASGSKKPSRKLASQYVWIACGTMEGPHSLELPTRSLPYSSGRVMVTTLGSVSYLENARNRIRACSGMQRLILTLLETP